MTADDLAAAYWTGRIDARRGQPRRVDLADRGPIADAYHHGYDDWQAQR